ncbi:hypothetical protein DPMN_150694 [Dreissena polymorpha]|uniref:Uncharacterized protein n=1 Tax=Dreissena polymorpha TaxID=45954 RepID=A0A9D4J5U7_DREPO|nr:hypothetical protein DPMN_150694 [Dreissena polymorpha]
MLVINKDSPGLWEVLHGMNIKNLRLQSAKVYHAESMLQSLSSFTQLETVIIYIGNGSPNLWKGLCGLDIKSLSLSGFSEWMYVINEE